MCRFIIFVSLPELYAGHFRLWLYSNHSKSALIILLRILCSDILLLSNASSSLAYHQDMAE